MDFRFVFRFSKQAPRSQFAFLAVCALISFSALGITNAADPAKNAEAEPRRILLLYPGQFASPGVAKMDRAIRESLLAAFPEQPLQIDSDGLADLRAGGSETQEKAFVELLLQRYGEHPPHLIVAHSGVALTMVRNRNALWPDAPLMFVGVPPERVRDGQLPSDVPTAFGKLDFVATFELALRLQPRARRALVVYGTSPHESYWGPNAVRALEPFKNRIEIEAVVGRTPDELVAIVRDLKQDDIVFYLGTNADRAGRSYQTQEVVKVVSAASKAPLFTPYDAYFESGVVGSMSTVLADEAKPVGEMARRLLAGEPAARVGNVAAPASICRIDWRGVLRWRIDTKLIPRDCEILFREPTYFQKYGNELIAVAAGVVFLLLLTTGYLFQIKRRREAELQASSRGEELAHASRLASAGQLTASITHEMNQPLSAILGNAEVGALLLSRDNPPLDELRRIFDDIRDADLRASSFIAQLRGLLTKRPIVLEPLRINEVVVTTLRLLERAISTGGVVLSTELADGLPAVAGDRVHLQQVILNLIVNAMEAMASVPPERKFIKVLTDLNADKQVRVSVIDNGPGIPVDAIERLFDPFYTTKSNGMGLGLSLVHTIIEAHGGRVWAESPVEGKQTGATFRFTLPVAKKQGDK